MSTPAIIVIVLTFVGLLVSANVHGKPTTNNFWITLISTAIQFGLLYWGGFFNHV